MLQDSPELTTAEKDSPGHRRIHNHGTGCSHLQVNSDWVHKSGGSHRKGEHRSRRMVRTSVSQ